MKVVFICDKDHIRECNSVQADGLPVNESWVQIDPLYCQGGKTSTLQTQPASREAEQNVHIQAGEKEALIPSSLGNAGKSIGEKQHLS